MANLFDSFKMQRGISKEQFREETARYEVDGFVVKPYEECVAYFNMPQFLDSPFMWFAFAHKNNVTTE